MIELINFIAILFLNRSILFVENKITNNNNFEKQKINIHIYVCSVIQLLMMIVSQIFIIFPNQTLFELAFDQLIAYLIIQLLYFFNKKINVLFYKISINSLLFIFLPGLILLILRNWIDTYNLGYLIFSLDSSRITFHIYSFTLVENFTNLLKIV